MREFTDEVTVLSRWLGRDVAAEQNGGVPVWSVFRFRDAVVFAADGAGRPDLMYLVRGSSVREFVVSQGTIDEAYAGLGEVSAEPSLTRVRPLSHARLPAGGYGSDASTVTRT